MTNKNPFFTNNGPFKIIEILKKINLDLNIQDPNSIVDDIKDLSSANENDITFLNSNKYKDIAINTKASFCITTSKLQNLLPKQDEEGISYLFRLDLQFSIRRSILQFYL